MAVDYFLKIDGIQGESQDAKHKGEIQLDSFRWGVNKDRMGGVAGPGASRVTFHLLECTAKATQATPKLMVACASGTPIKSAVLTVRKAGKVQEDYMRLTLTYVLVTSFTQHGAPESEIPLDTFGLTFTKLEIWHKMQNPDGTVASPLTASFDLMLQTGG